MAERRRRRRRRRRSGRFSLVVYLLARSAAWGISRLPLSLSFGVARSAGRIAYHIDARHRRIGRRNIEEAYRDALSRQEKERILRGAFCNLALIVVEVIHAARLIRPGREGPYLETSGGEAVLEAASRGEGLIFVSGHLGNWEFLATAVRAIGLRIHGVQAPRRNPRLDDHVARIRQGLGQEAIPKRGAVRQLMKVLRSGESVGIMSDQNQRREGIFVDFFGRKASTVRSAALLSLRTGAPIVFFYDRRLPGHLRHRVRFLPPMDPVRSPDPEADVMRITQEFTRKLEEAVREAPDQYLWLHRRWRTRPPGELKARVPAGAAGG